MVVIECDVVDTASNESISNRKCNCGHSAFHLERTFITFINNYMSDVELSKHFFMAIMPAVLRPLRSFCSWP